MTVYHSAKTLSEYYDISLSTAKTIIREIRLEIEKGRYPPTAVLTNCGTRVEENALIDYLQYRRALKNTIARDYVPAFGKEDTT